MNWRNVATLASALLAGCVQGPYALVTGRTGASPAFDTEGVIIRGVDGQLYFDDVQERRISPGPHALLVTTIGSSGPRGAIGTDPRDSSYVYFKAEPCMRYQIAARYDRDAATTQWKAQIVTAEPIAGCNEDGLTQ